MSHPEQFAFFAEVASANRDIVAGGRLIEIGSYDVNGSVRNLFASGATYIGVDLQEGPGVDIVAYGHEVDHAGASYDLALSGECFEHDPHWQATVANMCRMTRPGGVVAFTCASRGRPEHGTTRTELGESPGTQSRGLDYYRNLEESDFTAALPLAELFSEHRFWYLPTSFDLYFAGVRKGHASQRGCLPSDDAVTRIRGLMSVPHRVARLPLRLAAAVVPKSHYQSVILPYWMSLVRIQDRVASGRYRRAPRGGA